MSDEPTPVVEFDLCNAVVDWALRELGDAFAIARGEQLHLLRRGYKPRAYGEAGLNEFSYVYGRFRALWQLADLPPEILPSALDVRREGAAEAYVTFAREVREGDTHEHQWR